MTERHEPWADVMARRTRAVAALGRLGIIKPAIYSLADYGICDLEGIRLLTERELARYPDVGKSTIAKLRPYLRPEPPPSERSASALSVTTKFDFATMAALEKWAVENGTTRAAAVRRLVAKALGLA